MIEGSRRDGDALLPHYHYSTRAPGISIREIIASGFGYHDTSESFTCLPSVRHSLLYAHYISQTYNHEKQGVTRSWGCLYLATHTGFIRYMWT